MHILIPLILAAFVLSGCASLPDVDPWLQYGGVRPSGRLEYRRPLTKAQADQAVAKLTRREGDLDILERQNALEEEVSGKPLAPGNQVALLHDGPNTYKAMFDAIEKATDHVHLEFYIVEDRRIEQPGTGAASCTTTS